MIHPVTLFYAVLCAITFWVSLHSAARDRRHAIFAAVALASDCLLSNISWFTAQVANWVQIDAAVMIFALFLLWRTLRPWKIVLSSLTIAAMAVHTIWDWLDDRSDLMMYAYPAALNAIFILQLLTVASNGFRGVRDRGSNRTNRLAFDRPRRPGDHSDGLRG